MNWPLALDPASSAAAQIAGLTWLLLAVLGVVFVGVCGALAVVFFGSPKSKSFLASRSTILLAGFALPVAVLSGFLVYSLVMTRGLSGNATEATVRVRITGEMWWWRVAYLDARGNEMFHDANEVHIPTGQTVAIELRSADVIHSFWVPQLGGKEDMIPGRTNHLVWQAAKAGVYAGQCAEFCGGPHALMGFTVIAHEPSAFRDWFKRQQQNAAAPRDALASQGAQRFLSAGCGACHAIRGSEANGMAGPDLSRVGARHKLAAGILPNNAGTLAGWIADAQAIKPGNRMPSYKMLSGIELRALAAYLEQLR